MEEQGDEQARRVGLNESIFRQVNEQVESLNRSFGTDLGVMAVICECADGECTERLEVPVSAYEQVRSDPLRYIVAPGHEIEGFESVVEQRDGFEVVRKNGTAADVAAETDPRS